MREQLSQRWLSCIRGTYTTVSWLYKLFFALAFLFYEKNYYSDSIIWRLLRIYKYND